MAEGRPNPLTLLALPVAIAGVFFGLQYFGPDSKKADVPDTAQAQTDRSSVAAPDSGAGDTSTIEALAEIDTAAREESQRLYQLEDEHLVASFSDLNTGLVSLQVKGDRYLDQDGNPFELVTTDKEQYLPLQPRFEGVTIPPTARWTVVESSPESIHFRWSGDGVTLDRYWELSGVPYQFHTRTEVHNQGAGTRQVVFETAQAHYVSRADEKGGFFARPSPTLSHGICQVDGDTVREDREGLLSEDETRPLQPHTFGPGVDFVALSSVYFAIIAAPEEGTAARCDLLTTDRGGTSKEPDGSLFEATLAYAPVELGPGQTTSFRTAVYAGPKDFDALEKFGHEAQNVIDLGWFSFIARGMSWLLRTIYGFIGNWGVAIILLTILVRLLLVPFVIPQFRNMAKQRALKPEIDKINALYKDDREKKGAAMMELWRKNKVNPLGGCLPVLLQMPIFFALYQTLSTSIELYHAPFVLWWQDLSSPDPYYVLPIMLGALMFVQQKLTPIQMDEMQAKVMLYAMPLMMTFFMLLLPAGLCLYMVTSSAIGIAQQRYMYWQMDKEQLAIVSAIDDDGDDGDGDGDDPETQDADNEASDSPKRAKPRRKKRTRRGRA